MTRSAWSRIAVPLLLVLSSTWILPSPIAAMSVEDWRRLPQPQRTAYVRGVIDAWNDQVEFAKAAKPQVAPPDDLAATIVNCVNSLSMTDAQALGVVEVYMREHPGALQNFPMSVTVRIALARACRVIGPGERMP